MELLSPESYARLFPVAPTVFDRVDFARLNAPRMHSVVYLCAGGMGMIIGRKDSTGKWRSPFSAPYATACGIGNPDILVDAAIRHCGADGLEVTLPAPVYGFEDLRAAYLKRARTVTTDLNFHYPLERLENCWEYMGRSARRNLRLALKHDFVMDGQADAASVYRFIAAHHAHLGYRMAMTEEAVLKTAQILPVDFFSFTLEDIMVGAAIIYHVAPGIVQLINWGDDPDKRHLRTIPFMAHALFTHYYRHGLEIFDLGPASVDGVPNTGLVDFKLSIGAVQEPKLTITL